MRILPNDLKIGKFILSIDEWIDGVDAHYETDSEDVSVFERQSKSAQRGNERRDVNIRGTK